MKIKWNLNQGIEKLYIMENSRFRIIYFKKIIVVLSILIIYMVSLNISLCFSIEIEAIKPVELSPNVRFSLPDSIQLTPGDGNLDIMLPSIRERPITPIPLVEEGPSFTPVPLGLPSILPDNVGKTDFVLLQLGINVDHMQPEEINALGMYKDILDSLDSDVEVALMVPNEQTAAWIRQIIDEEWGIENNINIIPFSPLEDYSLYSWAEDGMEILQDSDGIVTIIASSKFKGSEIAALIQEQYPELIAEVVTTELYFEGGGIITDQNYVYMYPQYIEMNVEKLGLSTEEVIQHFEVLFGRELVILGGEHIRKVNAHIDTSLTPVGNNTILLADPKISAEIFEAWSNEDMMSNLADLIGYFGLDVNEDNAEDLYGKIIGHLTGYAFDVRVQAFNEVELQLQGLGFNVIRIPAITGYRNFDAMYNNSLIEMYGDKMVVYMPVYGIPVLDNFAAEIFESIPGYEIEVRRISAESALKLDGGVQCRVQVLRRTQFQNVLSMPLALSDKFRFILD
ncbi:MAG: hypothetical protein P9X27_01865 [Candidatus Kaelpia aquatica]|nr:hypothetical protein [Candidatus Kaelpia aquatica]